MKNIRIPPETGQIALIPAFSSVWIYDPDVWGEDIIIETIYGYHQPIFAAQAHLVVILQFSENAHSCLIFYDNRIFATFAERLYEIEEKK